MVDSATSESVRLKYERLRPILHEKMRRHWAACEALALGRGGATLVAKATGISRTTIWAGMRELQERTNLCLEDEASESEGAERIRGPGGGRHALKDEDPTLIRDLEALVEPTTRGDPESPWRWTCKSTRHLAEELNRQHHRVSHRTIASLLHQLGYSLQANWKTREGASHPDRNAQFEQINRQVRAFQDRGQPVVSVDTKKKELVGDFRNAGQEWHPQGCPETVRTKDFKDKRLGKAIPYGISDLTCDQGWVSVGMDHDTAQFATQTLRRWWHEMGRPAYPRVTELLITADGGGSNGSRSRLWKISLQALADDLGLKITVCHFPPGTSKWNKIEHRMFCHITKNWRGRPLISRAVIVNLIGQARTRTGFQIQAELDENSYPAGIKVTGAELAAVQITRHEFHGEWNYTITPRS